MSYICEFCDNEFSSKSSLNLHQKKAKYCLKKQEEIGIVKDNVHYPCSLCNKEFSTKGNKDVHEQNCKITYNMHNKLMLELKDEYDNKIKELNKTIIELEKQISEYKGKNDAYSEQIKNNDKLIEKCATKSTTVNNSVNSNNKSTRFDVIIKGSIIQDKKEIKRIITDKYKDYVFDGGLESTCKFVNKNFCLDSEGNPLVVCSDLSRGILLYRGENKQMIRDVGGSMFHNLLSQPLNSVIRKIYIDKTGNIDEKQSMINTELIKLEKQKKEFESKILKFKNEEENKKNKLYKKNEELIESGIGLEEINDIVDEGNIWKMNNLSELELDDLKNNLEYIVDDIKQNISDHGDITNDLSELERLYQEHSGIKDRTKFINTIKIFLQENLNRINCKKLNELDMTTDINK